MNAARVPAWLKGRPMDPAAAPTERMPALPGLPFLHSAACGVLVGPTGAGRSAVTQAGLYDAAMAGQRCAYLGSEIGPEEFDARAALLAKCRSDPVSDELRQSLAAVRYLDAPTIIAEAWSDPAAWIEGVAAAFDVMVIDPLSAIASALGLDFDTSNAEYVSAYDRLIQPLTARGVAVLLLENVGHAEDAKRRAKGASAKSDRADITLAASVSANPPGLLIRATKVRSIRAPFQRGAEWLVPMDSQRIEPHGQSSDAPFRPTRIMERVSETVERDEGLTANAIRTAIGGRSEYVTLALQLLIAEDYIEAQKDGQAHRHRSLKPYREGDDPNQVQPSPNQVPDPVAVTESIGPPSYGGDLQDSVSSDTANGSGEGHGVSLDQQLAAIAVIAERDPERADVLYAELEARTNA